MSLLADTIVGHCGRLRSGEISATDLVTAALVSAENRRDTRAFISLNPRALAEAEAADALGSPQNLEERPLHGIPISVKDIFDVAGMETTCGSPFYAYQRKIPQIDSAYVAAWRSAGAIIIGKTHLNEFAYGLTGENASYGACLQPGDSTRLTGGSSSGSAASVRAGSSLIGLGTDTGGSIRVPSALCGLVGFRHSPAAERNRGMFPLAPSFDTCGWLQQNLSDLGHVYWAVHGGPPTPVPLNQARIAFLDGDWLNPCDESIRVAFKELVAKIRESGAEVLRHQPHDFERAPEIFSAIQAFEAARVHQEFLAVPELTYDPVIRSRLERGLAMADEELPHQWRELETHCAALNALFHHHDFLIAPACPFEKLLAGEDQTANRRSLLQLTTPFSLAGLPALTFPWGPASKKFGWQVVARRGEDKSLVGLAESLARFLDLP